MAWRPIRNPLQRPITNSPALSVACSATTQGTIVATDSGPAGMALALVYEHEPGQYSACVASGLGTAQEGEAMTLLFCVRQLAAQSGALGHP